MEKRLALYLMVSTLVIVSYLTFADFMITIDENQVLRTYSYEGITSLEGLTLPDNEGLNETIMESLKLAGDYLMNHIRSNGKWDYEYNASSGESNSGYNLLRHAGTTYALSLIFKYGHHTDHYNGTLRTLNYMLSRTMRYERIEGVEIATLTFGTYTKLGGPALALMCILEVKSFAPELAYDREMEAYKNFILKMQKPNGSFQCFYGDKEDEHSDYYPGEALLALATYHRMTGDEEVLDSLRSGLEYYNDYFSDGYTAYSPWATEPIAYLHSLEGGEDLVLKANSMANSCKKGQVVHAWGLDPFYIGAFSSNPRASTASRIESVCDAYLLALRNNDINNMTRYYSSMNLCAGFLMRFQIGEDLASTLPDSERSLGGIPNSSDDLTIRIDNVQHTAIVLTKVMVYQRGPDHI